MKINKRLSGILLIVAAIALLLPFQIIAAGNIDLNRECSLTVSYQDDDVPLSGANFAIYLVATLNQGGEPVIKEEYARYRAGVHRDEDSWKSLATTLEGYILRDKVEPVCSGTTDSRGFLTFPENGKKLLPGLYLLLGSRHTQDGKYYDAQPSIVALPSPNKETGEWFYNVTVNPKHDSHKKVKGAKVKRKVLKVWDDDGLEHSRPEEIPMQLLKDGEVFDTKNLNAENNWRHVWDNLDDAYVWHIVEADPGAYNVEIVREDLTFVITNTRGGPHETTTGTTSPNETTVPSGTTTPGGTTNPNVTTTPTTKPDKPDLPRTGQLWWPVPLLIAAGLVFIVFGLLRRRGIENEE